MASLPIYDAAPDVRGYVSSRVFDGNKPLDQDAAKRHRARLARALEKHKADRSVRCA